VRDKAVAPPERIPRGELVVAFVSPLGTPLDDVQAALIEALREHWYEVELEVRISQLLDKAQVSPQGESPEAHQERLMDAGNALRDEHGGGILALMAIATINASRNQRDGRQIIPQERKAYVIRSLKHPKEVERLRVVYGKGFFLLGVSAPRWLRRETLRSKNFRPNEAERLLDKDAGEADEIGQQTRDTFALADAYLWIDGGDGERVKQKLRRILDLLFSCPFHPPTQEEHAMFMAYAAALRSSDLSRQVGAVVANRFGDVVASGANEAPTPGGGTYWPPKIEFDGETNDLEGPDYLRGYDSNERERNKILAKVIAALVPDESEPSDDMGPEQRAAMVDRYKKQLKGTGILDLTEFGRAVHAEMAALMSCARSGVTPVGGTLYCTTFPCHNCAKHIVASGITKVVYVEPYPKSKAKDLHADAISLPHEDDKAPDGPRVEFRAFEGIGPRRFVDLFSVSLGSGWPVVRKRKGADGARTEWRRGEGSIPRLPLNPLSYLDREALAASYFVERMLREDGNLAPQETTDDRAEATPAAAEDPDV
jgi:deoxycytidylate deaminase